MKRFFLMVMTVFIFAGCKDALVEELKKTPIDPAEPDTTYGVLFDSVFSGTQWSSSVDENGTESVTATGLFDWKEGAGMQESSFRMEKDDDGRWAPVAVTAGGEEISSSFAVGISFLIVCSYYKEMQLREAVDAVADSLSPVSEIETVH